MNKGYSAVYKHCGRSFIYDFDRGVVLLVMELTCDCRELFESDELIKDGKYGVILEAGLSHENWLDKGVRDDYLAEWCDELDNEIEDIDLSEFV